MSTMNPVTSDYTLNLHIAMVGQLLNGLIPRIQAREMK